MNSIIDLFKNILGLDSSRNRAERYFAECEDAYEASKRKQTQTTKES